jgi:hypothetical protein
MYLAEDFCLWHNDDDDGEEEDDQITQFDLSPVWKKGGGATAYGGETNDYWTTVEKLENGSTKFTSTRMLNTGDPYDYVVETGKWTNMAFSIIYEGKERLGSFEIQLEGYRSDSSEDEKEKGKGKIESRNNNNEISAESTDGGERTSELALTNDKNL